MNLANIKVEFLNSMGSDLDVVNAARVSFAKESLSLNVKDVKLIEYLAEHGHWTPFAHCYASFRVKMPIFVARQLIRHTVGLTVNEVSRRYVDDEPEFYLPTEWRKRVLNLKQGSSETEFVDFPNTRVKSVLDKCLGLYNDMLEEGVAPELARMVLPLNTMTEWVWSGSLYAFARVCKLRLQKDAQKESRILAEDISSFMRTIFPHSWKVLVVNHLNNEG